MIRTSIVLPPTLHQRLTLFAKQDGKPISEFVRDALDRSIAERERLQIKQMHSTLRELEGVIKSPVSDASSTIDEVLYGKGEGWHRTNSNNDDEKI